MATGGARGVRSGQDPDRGAAGKVAEEAAIRVFASCSTSSSSSFWRRPRPSRNSGLPPSQTDKSVPGATARSRTGRWATTCARPSSRRRSRPAAPTAPSSAARHRVRGRAASTPRNARSARAGSPTTSRAVRHSGPRHQPAGRPNAVLAPSRSCRRSPASSSPRPRPCFHDASWEEAAVAHLLQRPMSMISDQQQVAPCRGTLTCKFSHRKRGQEIGPC